MFNDATNTVSVIDPGRYILKLVRLEPLEEGQYGPSLKWIWNLADAATGTPLYNQDGEKHEFWGFTSVKLTPGSKARAWVEALLGRELAEGENGASIAQEIVGKKALALIGPNEKTKRDSILSIQVYRTPTKAANGNGQAKTEPEPAAVSAGAASLLTDTEQAAGDEL